MSNKPTRRVSLSDRDIAIILACVRIGQSNLDMVHHMPQMNDVTPKAKIRELNDLCERINCSDIIERDKAPSTDERLSAVAMTIDVLRRFRDTFEAPMHPKLMKDARMAMLALGRAF